jgi:hypothetical protein
MSPSQTRPKDLPRKELMALAAETLKRHPNALVHFKFTCSQCGTRCSLETPNTLYESGECYSCGASTVIEQGGFDLILNFARTKA